MTSSKFASYKLLLITACAILFVVALIPRLLIHEYSLPFVEHPDEPASYLKAQEWQGLFDLEGYHDGYPPAFLALNLVVQLGLQANGPSGLSPTVQLLRLFAAFASAGVAVFLFLSAYSLTQPLGLANALAAGIVAGSLWAFSPIAVEYIYATPDPYVFLFSAIALYTAIAAVNSLHGNQWALISICAGLAAVFFKYSALPVIAPGFLVLGYRAAFSAPNQRSSSLRAIIFGIVLVAISALFLLGIYGASSLNTPGTSDVARSSGFANLLNLQYFTGNLNAALTMVGVPGAILILLSPILLLTARRYMKTATTAGKLRDTAMQLALCYWLLITVPILINTFNPGIFNGVRFLIPATIAACVLVGTTVAALCALPIPNKSRLSAAITCFIGLLFAIPALDQTRILVADRQLPDSRVVLRQWADQNLAPGSVLVTVDNHKTFNPIWGGLPYQNWFDWVEQPDLTIFTPEEWHQEAGVDYIAYPADQWETASAMLDSDDVLYLGEFGGEGWRGPHTILARVEPLQHQRELNFANEIALQGFEFDQLAANVGETFSLHLFWEALAHPQANYSAFLHLTSDEDNVPLAQADGAPGGSEQQTGLWQPEQRYFSDPFELTLPANLEPGNYVVRIGLYDYLNGARLPVAGTDRDSAILFNFRIDDNGTITELDANPS